MKIPLSSPEITAGDIELVSRVLRSSRLTLGPELAEFEAAVADYVGLPFAVGLNSGTSALHLSIRALGISAGDEVILPSFSYVAPANAICYERAIPIFVEIDADTMTLDPEKLDQLITPRTRSIIVVHTFGCPADIAEIVRIARRRRLFVIEDACEGLGAEIGGRRIGSFGDIGVFGFSPNKPVTCGEGGVAVTNDAALAARMRALRNQGKPECGNGSANSEVGYSYRLSEMHAALGAEQLKRLEQTLDMREAIAKQYRRRLANHQELALLREDTSRRISWFTFPILLSRNFTGQDRDRIVADMTRRGIECGKYFAPLHLQPAFRSAGRTAGKLALTESISERSVSLPLFNHLTTEQINYVCENLVDIVRAAAGVAENQPSESRKTVAR